MKHFWVSIVVLLGMSLPASAVPPDAASGGAVLSGVVFLDSNGNGVRDDDEAGLPDVRITNGIEVQTTGADGRYAFSETADGFVRITRPDGFACSQWYRRVSGDFALVPEPRSDEFFFIQISDIHAYANAPDFALYSLADAPEWLPSRVGAYALLWAMWTYYDGVSHDDIAAAFGDALAPYQDTRDLSNSQVLVAYKQEFERPGSELGNVLALQRQALAEVAALAPAFVVSTGDLVLEGNTAPGEVVEPWFELYLELSGATGLRFYNTIGNNEITGSRLEDMAPSDPRYGKRLFERFHGPTTFSFDRGPFHFVAIDTHLETRRSGEAPEWEFEKLGDRVAGWLDADLAAHPDPVLVALNHEPFHSLPEWTFYDPVDDRGLFAKHGVPYSIAGHIHRNGIAQVGDTTHITTGALSGMRWMVPPSLHPRGYRLFYARERRLYSAWKEIGAPLVAFVHPAPDDSVFATGAPPPAPSGATAIVAVAADVSGPFETVELRVAGTPVPIERWGDFFVHAVLPAGATDVELRGVRADGGIVRAPLSSPPR
jgi:Icc protein